MKYKIELTEQNLNPQSKPNEAEIFIERMLQEFKILREIWESERKL